MNIFLSKHKFQFAMILQVALFAFASCEDDNVLQCETGERITWNVVSSDMQNSRALIEDDSSLQTACSIEGKSIGIKSFYDMEGVITQNVLGNETGDVSLIYSNDTSWDNYKWWTYGETAAEWVTGVKYTFNAYYPKYVAEDVTSSSVSPFVMKYNTELYQEDLMMAYKYVDTESSSFKQGNAVTLNMLHMLSALKFQFSFINADGTTYDDSDALTAFWIENTAIDKGLFTMGELEFGTYGDGGVVSGETINWNCISRPEPSAIIYEWTDAEGVEFSSNATEIIKKAVAYSTNADGNQKYAQNDGFILVVPQENDGTINICYRLKNTGDKVYRVTLSKRTYEPAVRYIYDIRFGKNGVDVKLSIAKWNEIKSSYDIPL